mmetsp:Transcript_6798/g.17070  ORF Transcript_6798/g.17070 Transcript_6798/m.17070 type:complete len:719 (+) Transcript_6798:347-2503(+)
MKSESMGHAVITAKQLADVGVRPIDEWLKLRPRSDKKEEVVSGEVHIKIEQVGGKTSKLYGVPLDVLMEWQATTSKLPVPEFLRQCTIFTVMYSVATEGLWRLASDAATTEKVREQLNEGEEVKFTRHSDPNMVGDLLKSWLRSLPTPLLLDELYLKWLDIFTQEDRDEDAVLMEVRALLKQVPALNKVVLTELLCLAHHVAANHTVNKMTLANLGIVLMPNLLWAPKEYVDTVDPLSMMANETRSQRLWSFLVRHWRILFDEADAALPWQFEPMPGKNYHPMEFDTKLFAVRKTSERALMSLQMIRQKDGGQVVVSGDKVGNVYVFSADPPALVDCLWLFPGERAPAQDKAILRMLNCDDRILLLATPSQVLIYDWKNKRTIKSIEGVFFAFTRFEDEPIVHMGGHQTLACLNLHTFEAHRHKLPELELTAVQAVSPTQVWGSANNEVVILDVAADGSSAKEVQRLSGHESHVLALCSVTSSEVWSADVNGDIIAWDTRSFAQIAKIEKKTNKVSHLLKMGSAHVLSNGWEAALHMWNVKSHEFVGTVKGSHDDSVSDMVGFFNTSRGKYQVWSCSPDRSLCVWSSAVSDAHVTLESLIDQAAQLSLDDLRSLQAHITRLLVPPPDPVSGVALPVASASSPSCLRRALPPPLSARAENPSPLSMSTPAHSGNGGDLYTSNPLAASVPVRPRPPKLSPRPPSLPTPQQAPPRPTRGNA